MITTKQKCIVETQKVKRMESKYNSKEIYQTTQRESKKRNRERKRGKMKEERGKCVQVESRKASEASLKSEAQLGF